MVQKHSALMQTARKTEELHILKSNLSLFLRFRCVVCVLVKCLCTIWLAEKDLLSLAACEQTLHLGNMVGSLVSVAHERRGKSRGNSCRAFCLLLKMEFACGLCPLQPVGHSCSMLVCKLTLCEQTLLLSL